MVKWFIAAFGFYERLTYGSVEQGLLLLKPHHKFTGQTHKIINSAERYSLQETETHPGRVEI
jgi:hypothetical protein